MKRNLIIFGMLTVLLFFSSCEQEDLITDKKIVGKWNATEFNASGTWETLSVGQMYAQFNADKTYKSKFNSSTYTGTWILSEKIVTCNVSGVYVTYTILSLDGNKATLEVKEPGYKPYSIKATRE